MTMSCSTNCHSNKTTAPGAPKSPKCQFPPSGWAAILGHGRFWEPQSPFAAPGTDTGCGSHAEAVMAGRLQCQERFSEFKHRKSSTKSFSHKHSSIMSMQPACCCICQENYNDREHCPRQLQCGHSICDICLRKLIGSCSQDSKRCPECRNPIR